MRLEEQVGGGVLDFALERRVVKARTVGNGSLRRSTAMACWTASSLSLLSAGCRWRSAVRFLCSEAGESFGPDALEVGDVVGGTARKEHDNAPVRCASRLTVWAPRYAHEQLTYCNIYRIVCQRRCSWAALTRNGRRGEPSIEARYPPPAPKAPGANRGKALSNRSQPGGRGSRSCRSSRGWSTCTSLATPAAANRIFSSTASARTYRHGRGVCVVDPHGNHPDGLYRSLMLWLFEKGYHKTRTVHLVDPNASTHTVGFNPLQRPDAETDLSVIANTTLDAFERVWGDEDTHAKPTIRRVLKGTFSALAELGLTISDAELLLDPHDKKGVRAWALSKLTDRYSRGVLEDLHQMALDERNKRDFRAEVMGPKNRLAEFVSAPTIRTIIGQTAHTLDIRAALDEGHIILVNLSPGTRVSDADAELLGRLLTRFIFFHAKRRQKPDVPFFFYLDECQRYLSGDVPELLGEARKYGLGCVLGHQWLAQLGQPDDPIREAVLNGPNLKAVFRLKNPKEAEELAETVIPFDLEQPVAALTKPAVVGYERTTFRSWGIAEHQRRKHREGSSYSESDSEAESESESSSSMAAEGCRRQPQ